MKKYIVNCYFDVEASDPEEAAEKVRAEMRSAEKIHFRVVDKKSGIINQFDK